MGHAKSQIGTQPMTYEQRANEVYAVVKEVTKEKIVLLGFNDGAFTGFKYAGMYSQTIKKLIAVGATELYPGMRKFQFSTDMAFKADREYFEQQLALMPAPNLWEEFSSGLMNFYTGLTVNKSVFEKIQCPVLLIAGDRDDGCPVQNDINSFKLIPDCRLGIVPNGPHSVIQTHFDVVWEMAKPSFAAIDSSKHCNNRTHHEIHLNIHLSFFYLAWTGRCSSTRICVAIAAS